MTEQDTAYYGAEYEVGSNCCDENVVPGTSRRHVESASSTFWRCWIAKDVLCVCLFLRFVFSRVQASIASF